MELTRIPKQTMNSRLFSVVFLAVCILSASDRPTVTAHWTDSPITVDGVLDEPIWQTIQPITEFVQRLPHDGDTPSEKSEMRIAYDSKYLYMGLTFHDKNPELIRSSILSRGGWIHRDDFVWIGLDTYHDRRNAYFFEMNPLGTQDDALITDENKPSLDEWAWDGVYISEGRITDIGWIMELAIPWTTLRFPDKEDLTMGIAIMRQINRKNESVIWPHIPLNYNSGIFQVSQYANLTGLENIKRGKNIQIKPYGIGGTQKQETEDGNSSESIEDAGLDLFYGLKSNLTLNLTYNTDFAQVEADNVQINLTRFNLFYPEKREFFLTRAKLFAFGNPRQTEMFFSRRIGLNQDVLGGSRLYGQVGKTSVGALNIHTRAENGLPATAYSAIRLRSDVRDRTTVGAIITDLSSSGGTNSVFGIDGQMRFWGSSSISAWYSEVNDSDLGKPSSASMIRVDLQNDRYYLSTGQHHVGRDFRPGLGFVQRDDMIGTGIMAGFTPRVGDGDELIRQWKFSIYARDVRNHSGVKETGVLSGGIEAHLESKDRIGIKVIQNIERLADPFYLKNGIEIPNGEYEDQKFEFSARSNQSRGLWAELRFTQGNYFGGDQTSLVSSIGKLFSNHLTLYGSVNRNIIDMPEEGEFTAAIYAVTAEMALNREWFGKALIQYDNFSEQLQIYWRINWIHTPGSDLFIVLNQRYDLSGGGNDLIQQAQVLKLTCLFQI